MANKKTKERFILTPSPAGMSFADHLTGATAVYDKRGPTRWRITSTAPTFEEAVSQMLEFEQYIAKIPYECIV